MEAEKEKLWRDAHEKLLTACNDDGAIIPKLIESLSEPLLTNIVKAYAGEEAGVGLHDIGNTIAEAWSELSVAKGCLEESYEPTRERALKYPQRKGRALEEA